MKSLCGSEDAADTYNKKPAFDGKGRFFVAILTETFASIRFISNLDIIFRTNHVSKRS